jgi:hypothetical protein
MRPPQIFRNRENAGCRIILFGRHLSSFPTLLLGSPVESIGPPTAAPPARARAPRVAIELRPIRRMAAAAPWTARLAQRAIGRMDVAPRMASAPGAVLCPGRTLSARPSP